MSGEDQPSTLNAYAQKAGGALQSGLAYVTGSQADEREAEARKDAASQEYQDSHAFGKVGNVNLSSSGAAVKDNPDRTEGSWKETIGSAKESVGGLFGASGLQSSGREQAQEGRQQTAAGQASDYVQGISERVRGSLNQGAAYITGDEQAKPEYQRQHDEGKTLQRSVEADLDAENSK